MRRTITFVNDVWGGNTYIREDTLMEDTSSHAYQTTSRIPSIGGSCCCRDTMWHIAAAQSSSLTIFWPLHLCFCSVFIRRSHPAPPACEPARNCMCSSTSAMRTKGTLSNVLFLCCIRLSICPDPLSILTNFYYIQQLLLKQF